MEIWVINKSSKVSQDEAQKMTTAVGMQLAIHVAPIWDRLPPQIYFKESTLGSTPDIGVILLFDDADQANALGYHSEAPNGQPYGKVFASPVLDNGGCVLYDENNSNNVSIASVLSHEACEMLIDVSINDWIDGPTIAQGSSYAKEVCDPVESLLYPITLPDGTTKVSVSNFVSPYWFDQMSPRNSLYDYLGVLQAPFSLVVGGYMVVRNAPGSEQSIFANVPPPSWRMAMKKTMTRTARRCLRKP